LDIAARNNNSLKHPEWGCYHHFSFIIQKNKILEWSTNRRGDALTFLGYEPHQKIHSEVDAYKKAKGIMDRSLPFEVVNIRLTKTGRISTSEPCKCCFAFLRNLDCKSVHFTTDIGSFASIRF
jgi:hypothetical protein